jgi:hypothetical protein
MTNNFSATFVKEIPYYVYPIPVKNPGSLGRQIIAERKRR